MEYRFHHLHLVCKDLEAMIAFFTKILNAELIARKKFGTADGASLNLDGLTINLRVSRKDEKMGSDASQTRYGYDHIGFVVEDLDLAYSTLKAKGFSFLMPPTDTPNARIPFFKGPEDITIELIKSTG